MREKKFFLDPEGKVYIGPLLKMKILTKNCSKCKWVVHLVLYSLKKWQQNHFFVIRNLFWGKKTLKIIFKRFFAFFFWEIESFIPKFLQNGKKLMSKIILQQTLSSFLKTLLLWPIRHSRFHLCRSLCPHLILFISSPLCPWNNQQKTPQKPIKN